MSPEGYAACCEAVGAFDFRGELHRYRRADARDLRRRGPGDAAGRARDAAGGIPAVRVVEIAHAGHLANVEQPQSFTDHLRSAA